MKPESNFELQPMAPHMGVDPYPDYKRLRETSPIYYSEPMQAWLLMGYKDVAAFLVENQRLQMWYANSQIARLGAKVVEEPYFQTLRHMMIGMDGAEYARIRMLFANAFTAKRVNILRGAIVRGADDLFSTLLTLADQDGRISVAGHETTAGAISLGMLALHRNPDQLALLKSQPELVPGAVLEMLRYDASGQATARVVMADMHFGDATIPAGSVLVGYIGSANRDPSVYPDPDRLDIRRKPSVRLLNFGGGVHACIGKVLARMELEVAFTQLLARLPSLRLETLDPKFRDTALLRGVKSMPVSW